MARWRASDGSSGIIKIENIIVKYSGEKVRRYFNLFIIYIQFKFFNK
ncbi:protein of unknown function [Xenorhabdus poinarii G6]|uniref:Uncharacterized protein n=1 Tax=Xenorhabdus poinarii G6 TaxID=1354304 RepID=A0A068R1Z3_9GAMM|nr:protein of unknown function [Xenorhabdus poinarii G6]